MFRSTICSLHTHARTHTHTHTHTCMNTHIRIHARTHMSTHTHTGAQQCFVVFDVLMVNDINLANHAHRERADHLRKWVKVLSADGTPLIRTLKGHFDKGAFVAVHF